MRRISTSAENGGGASVIGKAPPNRGNCKPDSVRQWSQSNHWPVIIYLVLPVQNARRVNERGVVRPIPGNFRQRRNRQAALSLFCLAPHGVCRAPLLTLRAVSFYLAFSPLPGDACASRGGIFSVTLSVTLSFRREPPRCSRGMLPYGVRTFLSAPMRGAITRCPFLMIDRVICNAIEVPCIGSF
jgi:hypothetical protein